MQPPLPPEAHADLETARTLTLVALVLEVLFFALGLLALVVLLAVVGAAGRAAMPLAFFGPFFLLLALGGILGLVWILLTYLLVYLPLRDGQPERALTPALLVGVLTLVFGGLIPGILLIVAYVKASDARTKVLLAQRAPP